jgi:adenosylmethionine-8-amino-7-oxononanoate aminotransferase
VSHVFHRTLTRSLPRAVRAEGVWIEDAEGRRYIDGAGGAIVVNVGHGDRSLVDAMAEQSARTSYVHGTVFTTEALESYADAVSPLLPLDDPRIYPVSGGSEAVETAIKLARAFHLARGEASRTRVIGRHASYHGNTLAALDVGGKQALRRPYEPWLGRFDHVDAAYEYRCPNPDHPATCGAWHAERLDRAIVDAGPSTVAAFVAEPVAGATLAASVPTDDYWPAVAEVCLRHGVLLIADEVMTGFGRTGRWFGVEQWGVRPDVVTVGKGSTSGYFPFGFAACSGEVFRTVRETGFVHGFTWSHNGVGAAVAHATLRRLTQDDLVEASARQGERLRTSLSSALEDDPSVGDVRGAGLMVGIELVADRASRTPFAREHQATERVLAAARDSGLLLYSSTGHVEGDGDLVMLGPPFVITDDECDLVVERTAAAIATLRTA